MIIFLLLLKNLMIFFKAFKWLFFFTGAFTFGSFFFVSF
jgi:hypothetical protein